MVYLPIGRVNHLSLERTVFGKSNFHMIVLVGVFPRPFNVDLILVVGLVRRPARVFVVRGIVFVLRLFVWLLFIVIIVIVLLAH
jgi:hypothetical protein